MSYQEARRDNPSWPRLVREWEGRLVRLPRAFKTKGRAEFAAGSILVVTHTYSGYLSLSDTAKVKGRRIIRMVRPEEVELLPKGIYE